MQLVLRRLEATTGDVTTSAAPDPSGRIGIGPLEVALTVGEPQGPAVSWHVANRSDEPVTVRSLALVFTVTDVVEPLRILRHGYQSWSPTGLATLGVDRDPSTDANVRLIQAAHHADQRTVAPGELRSEWLTVLADATGATVLAGFDGGSAHDGTFRLRRAADGGAIELRAEAFLGDAELPPGQVRPLHPLVVDDGPGARAGDAPLLLGRWAAGAGRAGAARTAAPYQVGWCSWYQYFHGVSEHDVRANLALAGDWPLDVFQVDDGYQTAIGDWLETNDRFPSGLAALAGDIAARGLVPGLWLAPFLVAPDSRLATEHPDWLAASRRDPASPLVAWWNPPWGGGRDGLMYTLDTTHPEVAGHLEALARSLREMGFSYLKLDFTFSPSLDGRWADRRRTPAERVRAGFDAIRRGAGDDAFLLACGAPLSSVVGVVDGMRIGPDVAPVWSLDAGDEIVPGYLASQPATLHACVNTIARSFMHRRLWLNDPDCLMLRTTATRLPAAAARAWAQAVGLSGGLAVVSDDLARLGDEAAALLGEVIALGRDSDAAARAGHPAVAPGLLDPARPLTMATETHRLSVDAATGAGTLDPPPGSGGSAAGSDRGGARAGRRGAGTGTAPQG